VNLSKKLSNSSAPRHVAIIMDGNGRWAKQRGLKRRAGHKAGTENIRTVATQMADEGVEYLTLYAFSTENWRRPSAEVRGILGILRDVLDRELLALHNDNIQLRHLGRLDHLGTALKRSIEEAIKLTQNNDGLTLSIAFDYGSRDEILVAVGRMLAEGVRPERLDAKLFGNYLYTEGIPDPDLIIRTGGEKRLSNFLLWQAAYSEYYFTSVLWPDFDCAEVIRAIHDYTTRQRRFGGLKAESI
jgi:undecaprenyl diphosphate synthase